MSVACETLEGDFIYNISEWCIALDAKDGVLTTRDFHIGDRLVFLDAYLNENNALKPYAWSVKFRCEDGFIGEAADFNFFTEDEWTQLKEYFEELFNVKDN